MKQIAVIPAFVLALGVMVTVSADAATGPAPAYLITGFAQSTAPQPPSPDGVHQHGQPGANCCMKKMESKDSGAGCAMAARPQASNSTQTPATGQGCCCCKGAQTGHAHQK